MSQNQGGLSEDELRDYIYERYGIKLDRDAFVKINKDVIIDIYCHFLDEVWPRWRRDKGKSRHPDSDFEPPIKILIIKWLRNIIRVYNNVHKVDLNDLLKPTRQRTKLTLNLLIYHRERCQVLLDQWEEDKARLMTEQKGRLLQKEELARKKEQIEDLAIKLSTLKPVDELKASILEGQRVLESLKQESEEIAAEAKDVKSKLLEKAQLVRVEEEQAEGRGQEIKKLRNILDTLDNGLHIEKKVADTERLIAEEEDQLNLIRCNIAKAKKREKDLEALVNSQRLFDKEVNLLDLPDRIKKFEQESEARKAAMAERNLPILEHQSKEEAMLEKLKELNWSLQEKEIACKTVKEDAKICMEAKMSEMRERERASSEKQAQILKDIEDSKKERAELERQKDEILSQHERYIERGKKKVQLIEEQYQRHKERSERNLALISERRAKINTLMGGPEPPIRASGLEPEVVELGVNRTYIKDPPIKDATYIKDAEKVRE